MLAEREIQNIRSRFPIFSRKISLNSCSQGALSDAVEAAFRNTCAHGTTRDLPGTSGYRNMKRHEPSLQPAALPVQAPGK
jgi:hypothetical protein